MAMTVGRPPVVKKGEGDILKAMIETIPFDGFLHMRGNHFIVFRYSTELEDPPDVDEMIKWYKLWTRLMHLSENLRFSSLLLQRCLKKWNRVFKLRTFVRSKRWSVREAARLTCMLHHVRLAIENKAGWLEQLGIPALSTSTETPAGDDDVKD